MKVMNLKEIAVDDSKVDDSNAQIAQAYEDV